MILCALEPRPLAPRQTLPVEPCDPAATREPVACLRIGGRTYHHLAAPGEFDEACLRRDRVPAEGT